MSIKNWLRGLFKRSVTEDKMKEMELEAVRAKDEIRLIANAVFKELQLKTRKGSIQAIKSYLEEIKKDVRILNKAANRIYVEWHNLGEQIKHLKEDK